MKPGRLIWQILPSYLLTTILVLIGVAFYVTQSLKRFYYEDVKSDLRSRALLIEKHIDDSYSKDNFLKLQDYCSEIGEELPMRLTVIIPSGEVVCDSDENPAKMENHAQRPEFVLALTGKTGVSKRYSTTLGKNMLYVAIPHFKDDRINWALRTSLPISDIDNALVSIYGKIAFGSLIILLISGALSLIVSRRITQPIEKLRIGADLFAKGDLTKKLLPTGSYEIRDLALSMNTMAESLDERLQTIGKQQREQFAILSSMTEGILAFDIEGKLLNLNDAAERLFRIEKEISLGRTIQELSRNPDIQHFVDMAMRSEESKEDEVTFQLDDDERLIHLHSSGLVDDSGNKIGVLVIMNDNTRLKKLENVRREFISNATHELKTPITSIKGFVETILNEENPTPDTIERFMRIIDRQTGRLELLIEDMLVLSKIEEEETKKHINFQQCSLLDILNTSVELCGVIAEKKRITISIFCDPDLKAQLNVPFIEQAITNLIQNSIAYSDEGGAVEVKAFRENEELVISVTDTGQGIEPDHIPKLFERFYRVDKSRSREHGGTGLGLSIVKHVTQAHNGRVFVRSKPGEGSTFYIYLPSE